MPWLSEARGLIVADWNTGPYLDQTDPYLTWLDLSRFVGSALPNKALPVIEEANNDRRFRTRARGLDDLLVLVDPARRATAGLLRFEVAAATVSDDSLMREAASDQRAADDRPRDLLRRRGTKPVIGFIDYGCAFAHLQFRTAAGSPGTRVKAIWDQGGGERSDAGALQWRVPPGYWYGAETHRDVKWMAHSRALTLDEHIRRFMHRGVLDEETCYRHSGYEPVIGRRMTHGTHIMDLATGWPSPLRHLEGLHMPGPARPHDADIVFVQLPRHVAGKRVSGLLRANVYDAVRYIIDCTPDQRAVVINLSYGANAGPHDGSSVLEQALDWRVQRASAHRGVTAIPVVAAGNAREERLHARAELPPAGEVDFEWRNQPDDPSDSFVEIWLPGDATGFSVSVTAPGGTPSDWVGPGHAASFENGGVAAALVFPRCVCQSARGAMALLAVARTAAWPRRTIAPYGAWRIAVRNRSAARVVVEAWCERDIPTFGSEGLPRQGHFAATTTSLIDCDGTLNSIAHGVAPVVVGGHVIGGAVASFSGSGPGRGLSSRLRLRRAESKGEPRRRGPELLAPSDESPAQPGLLAAAVIGCDRVRLSGTSIAAAVATRRIVESSFVRPSTAKNLRPAGTDLHPDSDLLPG